MIIDDFCLPVISIFLIIETIAITKLISNIKAYKKALPIIVKKIADLNEGVSAIQGRIIALEPLLISPYTQKPCVYYSFNVEQKMKRGRGIGWWANLVSEKRYANIGIDDGTDIVEIDLNTRFLSIWTNQ